MKNKIKAGIKTELDMEVGFMGSGSNKKIRSGFNKRIKASVAKFFCHFALQS